jgi:hypothetical protein
MDRIQALHAIKKMIPKNPVTCEVGFFRGEYSQIINEILKPKVHYVIDTFDDKHMVSGDKDGNNIIIQDMTIMAGYSRALGYRTIKGTTYDLYGVNTYFDFIYIDADHSYEWVSKDLKNALSSVRPGAIIAGHDYSEHKFPGCHQAVNEFCTRYDLSIMITTNDGCPSYFIKVP